MYVCLYVCQSVCLPIIPSHIALNLSNYLRTYILSIYYLSTYTPTYLPSYLPIKNRSFITFDNLINSFIILVLTLCAVLCSVVLGMHIIKLEHSL